MFHMKIFVSWCRIYCLQCCNVTFKSNSLRWKITAHKKLTCYVTALSTETSYALEYFTVTQIYCKPVLWLVRMLVMLCCPEGLQPSNVLTLPSFCSLLYGPQLVTLQPNNSSDRRNITFTALCLASNLTVNWAKGKSLRNVVQSCSHAINHC